MKHHASDALGECHGTITAGGIGMDITGTLDVTPSRDTEYEAAIDRYLSEMERMKIQMTEKQQQIERLQSETQAMLAELKAA